MLVGGWHNGGWFKTWSYDDDGLAQERKRQQQHRDFLKIRENRGAMVASRTGQGVPRNTLT